MLFSGRKSHLAIAFLTATGMLVPGPVAVAGPGVTPDTGADVLTATDMGSGYAPTFTGNGYLGVRVPPAGQGYAAGTVPAQSELAGFYAQPAGQPQQRANIPTWSTFTFTDGGQDFTPGQATDWRQRLDLRDGGITTTARWTAPNGHVTDLNYVVFTDRARANVAAVRLTFTPHWSGTADVTDLIDGTPATETTGVAKGWQATTRQVWETVRTTGLGVIAGLASTVGLGPGIPSATDTPVGADTSQSVGQRLSFPVRGGHTYTLTKYVGVTSSLDSAQPDSAARAQSSAAAQAGFDALARENAAAWAALWADRIDVLGDPTLATQVHSSEFYLWSSTRDGVDWSVSPAGLSSNGYDGHIFWDAETWMYPTLLAQHPDLALGMNDYRFERLGAAAAHARQTGFTGARFPWESAFDGTEQIPPPASINSEGLFEQHITADVALAQWQYYQATGDRAWLRTRGWPVLSQAATFWAGRAQPGADGRYHISDVTGPDEENPDVNDEAYTTVAAAATLRMATDAAHVLGIGAPGSWSTIAAGLVPSYDPGTNTHPEFAGYQGQMVKQADVTMLQYPWQFPMPANTARSDIDYYVPRSDPGGPSMDDAINAIDTAALGTPGCSSTVYTRRSVEPFMRDVFDQFSETRTGGAFTFMTGIGGFLQEFLYGYSGLRWRDDGIALDPSLAGGPAGVVLHGLAWHGSRFTVTIGATTTRVSLDSGNPVPVWNNGHRETLRHGQPLSLTTRRPDRTPTTDLARCQAATATSAQPGADPLAAVDGSPATDWQPTQVAATLTVPLAHPATIGSASVVWGQQWPPPPAPNVPPPPGPVRTLRATDYDLLTSADGHHWTVAAQVRGQATGTSDTLRFAPVSARFVAVRVLAAIGDTPPMLMELTVPAT